MRKKLISITLCLVLMLSLALTATAAEYPPVFDKAGILSDFDAQYLAERAQEVSQQAEIDIVILTVPSLEGKSAHAYADDYYDYNGYREDGVIFLLAMAEREWYISTCGKVIDVLTDDVLYSIEEDILPDLSSGDYDDAFMSFINTVDVYMIDDPVGDALVCIFFGMVAGLVVAGISLLIMRAGMNTKVAQHSAENYLKDGSYNLNRNTDMFLYSRTSRRRKPEQSSSSSSGRSTTHTSSSGRTHGGRGGKF